MKAKKKWGQHWLHEKAVIAKWFAAMPIDAEYWIEIGPGQGALTKYLLAAQKKVLVIEIDQDCINHLQQAFADACQTKQLTIMHRDILEVDWKDLDWPKPWSIIGNLPYYIATEILCRLSNDVDHIDLLAVMVQKEVAERIVAQTSQNRSRLSNYLQYDWQTQLLFHISRGAFSPPPEVESSIVLMHPRHDKPLLNNRLLWQAILRQAFGQRRKQLASSLSAWMTLEDWNQLNIDKTLRPQALNWQQWCQLANIIDEKLRS